MRKRVTRSGVTVNAIAGSRVVTLGLDISAAKRKGLRGFGIRRIDRAEQETYWMRGMKTFESVEPHPASSQRDDLMVSRKREASSIKRCW